MVFRFRSSAYILSRYGLSLLAAGLDLAFCLHYIPDHPMKLMASFGSACCAAVITLALPPLRDRHRRQVFTEIGR